MDRQIKNAYEDFRELTKPAEKFLIEVQGFLNLCPLVCDLGDGIIEELEGKEDLLEVLDTIKGVEECYTAYSPENAHLGFEGMLVLHPKELGLVHSYFSPSETEINDAEEMLKLAKEAESKGVGVAIRNGKFIGPPMIKKAIKVIEKHKLIKEK